MGSNWRQIDLWKWDWFDWIDSGQIPERPLNRPWIVLLETRFFDVKLTGKSVFSISGPLMDSKTLLNLFWSKIFAPFLLKLDLSLKTSESLKSRKDWWNVKDKWLLPTKLFFVFFFQLTFKKCKNVGHFPRQVFVSVNSLKAHKSQKMWNSTGNESVFNETFDELTYLGQMLGPQRWNS